MSLGDDGLEPAFPGCQGWGQRQLGRGRGELRESPTGGHGASGFSGDLHCPCPSHLLSRAGRREGPRWAGGGVCFTVEGPGSADPQGHSPAPGPAGGGGVLAARGPAARLWQDLGLKVPLLTLQQHSGHHPLWRWTPALSTGLALGLRVRSASTHLFRVDAHRAGAAEGRGGLSCDPPCLSTRRESVARRRQAEGPGRSHGLGLDLMLQPAWAGRRGKPPQGVVTTPGVGWCVMHRATARLPPADPAGQGSGWLDLKACAHLGSEIFKATSLCICLIPPTFSRTSLGLRPSALGSCFP